jgi:ADP-dependent NAD(P)H-hydrate dehydratase / NAD(P)H-hydrate epimerase
VLASATSYFPKPHIIAAYRNLRAALWPNNDFRKTLVKRQANCAMWMRAVLIRDTLNLPILTAAQMREAEAAVIARGVSVDELMERAGLAVAEAVWRFGGGCDTLILCGPGNNGGDGYVAARHLRARGLNVRVAALSEPKTSAAIAARDLWSGPVETLNETDSAPILVDALFGTGLTRPLEPSVTLPLEQLCQQANFIIAVDVPSGVGTDDGAMLGWDAVDYPAHLTLALGALKPAHVLFPAAHYCGQVKLLDIGVSISSDVSIGYLGTGHLRPEYWQHKYSRALAVVSGQMPGAAQLAANAAAHIAGYTVLIAETEVQGVRASLVQRRLSDVLADDRFKTFVVGPGLGTGARARGVVETLLDHECDLVLDADALTILAQIGLDGVRTRKGRTILTPHEGEFTRLFGDLSGSKIDRARAAALKANAVIIYKGADTVITSPEDYRWATVAPFASHWLASAGTGDVLAGLTGAMLSFMQSPQEAASAAVALHGQIAQQVGSGLTADDMISEMRATLRANGYD